ncbi:FecR domain-containing protein [Erythrobacter sp. LQ02-29]|uniref:FecR family protein n=1 Tax=Erythrobacter sp. LQ02-29 TaxID=2920384 RepID=UPI001F4EBE06|nr:FecR domain-containing protein [Erythrobacter sp. LQ02-29]MCP9221347.1 FecR domain-containing protein [Erythrobacter sp. LQ02-29]
MQADDEMRETALDWAIRTRDAGFEDWDGFTLWLERDPAHARAYDAIAADLDAAAEALRDGPDGEDAGIVAANDDDDRPTAPVWKRRWFAPALAASLAVVAFFGFWQRPESGDQLYVTAPGETRQIALEDGSTIELAGDTQVSLDAENARAARLDHGQALFRIRHDAANPFRVLAGKDTLVDAGTVFDVRLGPESLEVGVAEGAVIVNPTGQRLELAAGRHLTRIDDTYTVSAFAPGEVGEWAQGRITFHEATLARIAADLSRATGTPFTAAGETKQLRLSGSILVEPVRDDPRALEPLLGIRVTRDGQNWKLSAE